MSDEEKLLESLTAYLIADQKHTIRIYVQGHRKLLSVSTPPSF